MTDSKVKIFWDEKALRRDTPQEQVTHNDIWQRWLEIQMISHFLRKDDRVIDVGCGNGYSTRIFSKFCKEIIGIDYSQEMIDRANEETRKYRAKNKCPIFMKCNVLELSPSLAGKFDVAISERCLINLSNFEAQKKAITNIASVLKPKGRFIFVEGSAEGRYRLNWMRKKVGIKSMPRVWHNINFKEKETLRFLRRYFTLLEYRHFGLYDFLSRVVHPLLVQPGEPKYNSKINEVAAKLSLYIQEFGDVSRVLFLVLCKK